MYREGHGEVETTLEVEAATYLSSGIVLRNVN